MVNENQQEYSADTFFGQREILVRAQLGRHLNALQRILDDISKQCMIRLMKIKPSQSGLSVEGLLECSSEQRCQTVSALLYDDATWRLEAAYLMASIGLFNSAYTNLRASLEAMIKAFIIERIDSQAMRFLKNEKVTQNRIEKLLTPEYNRDLENAKNKCSEWGVHTYLRSIQLTSLFGPSRIHRTVNKAPTAPQLHGQFFEVGYECCEDIMRIGSLLMGLLRW